MHYTTNFQSTFIIDTAYPPGPVRFSNPAACRRITRPCGTLPNFIYTAFMVTCPTEPGRCPVDIQSLKPQCALQQAARVPTGCSRHASWPRFMKKCIARHPAGNRRRPFNGRFYLIHSVRFASSIFVVKLYY